MAGARHGYNRCEGSGNHSYRQRNSGHAGQIQPYLPYTVYDLSGRVVAGDAQHGVFIVKQGNNTFKVMR